MWMKSHESLLEGPLSAVIKGIEVVIPKGLEKWESTGFSIRDDDGKPIWLHLFDDPAKFIIHRNVVSEEEWEIFLEI